MNNDRKKWDRFWPALRCEQYLFYEKALVRTVFIAYNGFVVSDLLTGLVGSGLKIAGELFLVYEKRRWFRSNPDTKCCKCIAGLASVDMAVFQSKHLQTNTKSFSVVVGFSCIYGKKNFCKLIKPLERERWSNPLKFCDKIRVCSLSKPRDINLSIFQNTVRWIFWLPGTLPLSNLWRAGMLLHLSTYFPHFTLHTCTQFLFPFKIISLFFPSHLPF